MKEELAGKESGQSILEVVIALVIGVMTISAIIFVALGNQSIVLDSRINEEALQLARESLESVRAASQTDFSSVSSSTTTSGIYTKEIAVTSIDDYTKKVLSRVSWNTDPLRPQKIELTQLITDPVAATSGGGDPGCNGIAGDWQHPATLGSVDLGPGNSATGLDVINKIVYMTSVASSQSKPDFFIVDATDGANPMLKSSLETGPGLNAVDVAGNYAYLANNKTTSQLKIVDVSNVTSPVVTASLTLPSIGAEAISITYNGSKVYVGTKKGIGPEFHIIDVTNPLVPVELGSLEIGEDVNAIKVVAGKAYLATSLDSAELKILDVSNPLLISQLGSYDAPAGRNAYSLYVSGARLYLGREGGSQDFSVLDISNPVSIQLLGSKTLNQNINAIVNNSYLSFLGTEDPNQAFQVLNSSSISNITLWSSLKFPQVLASLDCENNIVYAAMRSNDALRIITAP